MPIYEYKCDCGHVFEVLIKFEDKLQRCPKCKEMTVNRQFSAPAGYVKRGVYDEFL